MKVFVSYSHAQAHWVRERLEPCLRAGGVDVLIDHRGFVAGPALVGQMDALQDQADRHVLVLTADYIASASCRHEMNRAIALDPSFARGLVIPVRRDHAPLPPSIASAGPLYADLRDDTQPSPWQQLLSPLGALLGTTAPDWLRVRDDVADDLQKGVSVNLVTKGDVAWRGLIDDLMKRSSLQLAQVDLDHGATSHRQGLVRAMLTALGVPGQVPLPPEDLNYLSARLEASIHRRLVMRHADHIPHRPDYDTNLFGALRYAIEHRHLVLMLQSRAPFRTLIPQNHEWSNLRFRTIELIESR